jgi:hypothetical protein
MLSSKTQPRYDVFVSVSGAGSAQTAYTCTMTGAKMLTIGAGRDDFSMWNRKGTL